MNCLQKAIIEIAYDNGAVNRNETEEQVTARVWKHLRSKFTETELNAADYQLNAMSPEDFEEFTIGETDLVDASALVVAVAEEIFESI